MPRLENLRKINVFGRPQSWEILGFSGFFRIFRYWKTATLVGQDSAWEVQKRYFRPKNLSFLDYFWPFPIIWGFPLGPLLAPLGPYVTPDIRPIGRC